MAEKSEAEKNRDIADYYLDRYRALISVGNKVLGITLLVLLINWLMAVEPHFQTIKTVNHVYKLQVKKIQKKLVSFNDNSYRLSGIIKTASGRYTTDSALIKKIDSTIVVYQHKSKHQPDADWRINNLKDSLERLKDDTARLHYQITEFKTTRALFKKLQDSIPKLKRQKDTLLNGKNKSVNESLKGYDWQSLISFVSFVAADPKEGSMYLMGTIALMLTFATVYRWLCLQYLAKAVRIYKSEPETGLNRYKELKIFAPFWLNPVPGQTKAYADQGYAERHVSYQELQELMGHNQDGIKGNVPVYIVLGCLLALQIRLFYIDIIANEPVRFDFVLYTGAIFLLISLVVIGCFWIWPLKIDDHFNNEEMINKPGRRAFIAMVLLASGAMLIRSKKDKLASSYNRNAKRYVHKKKIRRSNYHSEIPAGLYVHQSDTKQKKSKKRLAYFIEEDSNAVVIRDIPNKTEQLSFISHLSPLTLAAIGNKKVFRFSFRRHSYNIEMLTLQLIRESRTAEAMDFIFNQLVSARVMNPKSEMPQAKPADKVAAKDQGASNKAVINSPRFIISRDEEDGGPDSYHFDDEMISKDAFFHDGLRLADLAVKLFTRFDDKACYLGRFLKYYGERLEKASFDHYGSYNNNRYNFDEQRKRLRKWQSKKWIAKHNKKDQVTWNDMKF